MTLFEQVKMNLLQEAFSLGLILCVTGTGSQSIQEVSETAAQAAINDNPAIETASELTDKAVDYILSTLGFARS